MNVWIINQTAVPPSMGGLVRHYYFSKYLAKKGHNVRIFSGSQVHNTDVNFVSKDGLFKEISFDGVEYTFVRTRSYSSNGVNRIISMLEFPLNVNKLANGLIVKGETPDVIYTSSPSPIAPFFAIRLAKRLGVKSVLEIRDLWPESIVAYHQNISKSNIVIKMLYILEKWMYKKANAIVFTIPGGLDYIGDKRIRLNTKKIHHINNGVDLDEYAENLRKYKTIDPDLDDESIFKAVYMGSVRKSYNIASLLDVAEELKELGQHHIKILVYGDGPERIPLEKDAKNRKLENIVFKGKVEKKYIPGILSKADLNLVNVFNTGLDKYGCSWNKLFEYFASEKPILSNFPVNYDLITENKCGVAKKMSTPKEYAEELIRFSNMDEQQYREMCKNCSETARRYDYRELTNQLEKILFE